MILHTVNKTEVLERCLAMVSEGDTVLLIEDGVYASLEAPSTASTWASVDPAVSWRVLETDLAARGISDKMRAPFEAVSQAQFIDLTLAHEKVISWG